jgi:hypothetical protein
MKKKQVQRSIEQPGQPRSNQSGFPYGTGSLQMRGRTWWIMYRDGEGRSIQENSRTEDYAAARHMLASRAIATLRARLAVLEGIASEGHHTGSGAGATGAEGGSRSGAVPAGRGGKTRTGGKK